MPDKRSEFERLLIDLCDLCRESGHLNERFVLYSLSDSDLCEITEVLVLTEDLIEKRSNELLELFDSTCLGSDIKN